MGVREELDRRLVAAMRERDTETAEIVRAVRARVTEEKKKADFSGEDDDALWTGAIERYVKQLNKALPDFDRAGEAGAATAERYRREIQFLSEFLPKKLDEAATRELVGATIEGLGVGGPQAVGRVMGAVMKEHKDSVDPALVRRLVEEALG